MSASWRAKIDAAAAAMSGLTRRTPVLALPRGAFGADAALFLKLEHLQQAGSFKARGAVNRLIAERPARVVAASGGNHGAAVAFAAQALGIEAEIFAPELSSPAKRARIRGFGARLVVTGADYAEAAEAAAARAADTGATNAHAYDHPLTIAGQGTVAREFLAQVQREAVEPLDTVLVAVGGGGLAAGVAAWCAGAARVVAVEPERCAALHAALEAGRPVDAPVGGVAADALGARRVGALPYEILAPRLGGAALVEDAAIVAARRRLWDDLRLAVEPAAAAGLAALLSGAYRPERGERVGVILCGANTTVADLDDEAAAAEAHLGAGARAGAEA